MPRQRANGEGSIYKRKDGRWVAELELGRNPDGKPRRWRASGATRREVAEALARAIEARQRDALIVGPQAKLEEYLTWWLRDVAAPRLRQRTLHEYEGLVRRHAYPTLGALPLGKVTPQHLASLYAALLAQGLAPRTVQYLHAVLHRALQDALRQGLVARNVADLVDAPRARPPEIRPLDVDAARGLLAAVAGTPADALVTLALLTGLRQGELLGLRWADLDLEGGWLHLSRTLSWVRGVGPTYVPTKSRASQRPVHLVAPAVAALKRHRARQAEARLAAGAAWRDEDLVFASRSGGPLEASNMTRTWWRPALAAAGLGHVRFHDLRHSCASLLFGLGYSAKVVQDVLGHGSIGVTADTYGHLAQGIHAEALESLGELLTAPRE